MRLRLVSDKFRYRATIDNIAPALRNSANDESFAQVTGTAETGIALRQHRQCFVVVPAFVKHGREGQIEVATGFAQSVLGQPRAATPPRGLQAIGDSRASGWLSGLPGSRDSRLDCAGTAPSAHMSDCPLKVLLSFVIVQPESNAVSVSASSRNARSPKGNGQVLRSHLLPPMRRPPYSL